MMQILIENGKVETQPFEPILIEKAKHTVPKWRTGKWKVRVTHAFFDHCVDGVVVKWWYGKWNGRFLVSIITYDVPTYNITCKWDYTPRIHVPDKEMLPPKKVFQLIMPVIERFCKWASDEDLQNDSQSDLLTALNRLHLYPQGGDV